MHARSRGGDECLSFQLAPELVETIGDGMTSGSPCAATPAELMVLGELAEAAAGGRSDVGLDEAALCCHAFRRCLRDASASP